MEIKKKQSPSSINLFCNEPQLWVLKTYFGWRGSSNIYAIRGTLVEEVANLNFPDYENYCKLVADKFLFSGVGLEEKDLRSFWTWGQHLKKFDQYIKGAEKQSYCSGKIEGVELGGYIDFQTETEIFDLKTTNKLPELLIKTKTLPSTKKDNVRQQTCYYLLTKKIPTLLYLDEKGNDLVYKLSTEELQKFEQEIKETCKKMKKLLDMKKEDVIMEIGKPKNIGGIAWDTTAQKLATEVWKG